jgi:hypothetical protein
MASTLQIIPTDNGSAFAAQILVQSGCEFNNHQIVTGPIEGADFGACSTLDSNSLLATGTSTFTAGDLVILREGFTVGVATLTVEIDRDLYPDAWVQDDTPDGETVYEARFYVNPADLTLNDGDRFYHFIAFDAGGQPELRVGVKQNLTERRLFLEVIEDNGAVQTTEDLNELALLNEWIWIEVGWEVGSGDNNGSAYLCINAEVPPLGCTELSSLDNDTGAIDFVRWGAIDVPSNSTLGSLEMDNFQSGPFLDGFESGNTDAWSGTSED